MKVAFILPSLKNSAPINVAIAIAFKLVNCNNSVDVFYLSNEIGINLYPSINYKKISFFSKLDWAKYDVVHSHMLRPDLFIFLRKPLFTSVKTVSTIHNYVFPELNNYYNRATSYVFGCLWIIIWMRFNKLITLTKHASNYYSKLSINKNIDFVHNGRDILINYDSINRNDFNLITDLKSKFKYVIGVYCALIKRKRIDILIKHLSRTDLGCLVILGEGKEYTNLQNLVINLNLRERVIFLGNKNNAHQYNCLFDVYALPSEDEGFGLALIEAALHKKKIICSNIEVFHEIFNENCVTYFDLKDEKSIDNAIKSALANDNNSNNAYEKAIKFYSEEVMAENYTRIYKNLIF